MAEHAEGILSEDASRTPLPWWDGTKWTNGTEQFVDSYPSSISFVINLFNHSVSLLFRGQNITFHQAGLRI